MILAIDYMTMRKKEFADDYEPAMERIQIDAKFPPQHAHGWLVVKIEEEGRIRIKAFDLDRVVKYEFVATAQEIEGHKQVIEGHKQVIESSEDEAEEEEDDIHVPWYVYHPVRAFFLVLGMGAVLGWVASCW